jgi:hypothetical protein
VTCSISDDFGSQLRIYGIKIKIQIQRRRRRGRRC